MPHYFRSITISFILTLECVCFLAQLSILSKFVFNFSFESLSVVEKFGKGYAAFCAMPVWFSFEYFCWEKEKSFLKYCLGDKRALLMFLFIYSWRIINS